MEGFNQIIFVETSKEYDDLKHNSKFSYICKVCLNKKVSSKVRKEQRDLICNDCKKAQSRKLKHFEKPVLIKNLNEYVKVHNGTRIIYNCTVCGDEYECFKESKNRKKQSKLMCRTCSRRVSLKNKEKTKKTAQKQTDYNINSPNDIDKVPNEVYIHFECKQCGVTTKRYLQNKNRAKAKRLLCKKCGTKQTNLEKYGVENVSQNQSIKEKIKKTCLVRYGTTSTLKSKDVQNRIKQTNLKKYGVENVSQSKEIINLKKSMYCFDNQIFDSLWELAFYVFNVDQGFSVIRSPKKLIYYYKNEKHYYFPDFEINGQIYEIKGEQFWKKDGTMQNPYDHTQDELFEAKHQCGLQNNVIFIGKLQIKECIAYLKSKYTKRELNNFKLH